MKRFAYFTYLISCLLILLSCSEGKVAKMRQGLDSINMVNRSGKPFTVTDVEPYVQFFDKHGEPNDRLLAYYLLGLAYYDHGEAPMALRCYQDALDCVDTTSNDCDYAQLSRVYMQMSNVFYYQGLYHKQLEYIDHSVRYAWRGGDTLAAIMNYEMKSHGYRKLNMTDSMMEVCSTAYKLYNKYGYSKYAAIVLSYTLSTLIGKKEYPKAKQNMDIYESESGYFDSLRDIEKGREIYYKIKGYYYKGIGKSDSAEFYFRKELRDGKDFNNQNAGAMGLAQLYQGQHQSDSAAKYSIYAYAMNDSMYAQRTTETVERMQAMYDYSRNQEIAHQESARSARFANYLKTGFAVMIILLLLIYLIYKYQKEKVKEKSIASNIQYSNLLSRYQQAQQDMDSLQNGYEQFKTEKQEEIRKLQKELAVYHDDGFAPEIWDMEQALLESDVVKRMRQLANRGKTPSDKEKEHLREFTKTCFPDFYNNISHNQLLTDKEIDVCILIKFRFIPTEIATLLDLSKQRVTNIRNDINYKLFQDRGAKSLDANIRRI